MFGGARITKLKVTKKGYTYHIVGEAEKDGTIYEFHGHNTGDRTHWITIVRHAKSRTPLYTSHKLVLPRGLRKQDIFNEIGRKYGYYGMQ